MSKEFDDLVARKPTREFDVTISDGKVKEFWDRGFTLVERITTDEEVEWLRDVYDMIFSGNMKLLPGALVTETMFAYLGMGKLIYDSILGNDYNIALVGLLLATLMTLVGNLMADLGYAALDPRISFTETRT